MLDTSVKNLHDILDDIKDLIAAAILKPSPLILDMDGSGAIELTSLTGANAHSVYFDVNNDGYAEATAWVTGGDGDYFYGYAKSRSKSRENVSRETFSSIIPSSYLTETTHATRNARAV